jgi:filamentous hemagglutinin
LISCDGFSCQKYLTHSAYLLVENNALALPAPPVPVPGLSVGPGDQVKQDADKTIASGLDGAIKGLGDAVDKATQCSFGRACSSEEGEKKSQPNAGKDLTDEQKKELGGTGSGTPGGWGPEDEEGARNNEAARNGLSKDKLNQAASAPNRNGLTDAGRALQKHGGREGSVYSYTSQKAAVLNQEAQSIVNEILNNPNTKVESRIVFENKQKVTVVEATAPDGRALRFNADGSRLIGFREPSK